MSKRTLNNGLFGWLHWRSQIFMHHFFLTFWWIVQSKYLCWWWLHKLDVNNNKVQHTKLYTHTHLFYWKDFNYGPTAASFLSKFSIFESMNNLQYQLSNEMVSLGFEPGATGFKGWKSQTNPLSYGDPNSDPTQTNLFVHFWNFSVSLFNLFKIFWSKISSRAITQSKGIN